MPWKNVRSTTAGGRKSRRHSFFENRDPPALSNDAEGHLAVSIAGQSEDFGDRFSGDQSCHTASRGPTPPAPESPHTNHVSEDVPERLRQKDVTRMSKNRRFSLLKFRHASDPQLSRSYTLSAPNLTPPLPNPPSKFLILLQARP